MATLSTPIKGVIYFLGVGATQLLSNDTPSGTWSSSDTAIATVSADGLLTGVSLGSATITYTVGTDTASTAIRTILPTYTNGFDVSRLLPVLIGRKGWRQPTSTTFPFVLSPVNTSCISQRFYQRDNAVCQPEKLLAAQEDSGITETEFNDYLVDLQVGNLLDALTSVFRQPALIEEPKIIFEKSFRTSYKPIANSGKFCGWQLYTAKGDYTTKVDSVQLTMSAPCSVTLYLYNDLRQSALWSKKVYVTTGNDQTIFNIDDLILSRLDDKHKGGIFYLGYYQDEIAAQGVTASDVYLNWWENPLMFAYQGFEATSDYATKTFRRDTYFSNYRTYGLGVELSTYNDFTNTIIRQGHEFDALDGFFMVQKCIEEVMHSSRTNADIAITQEQMSLLYETLNGRPVIGRNGEQVATNYKTSIKNKIELEIKRVQDTFMPLPQVMSLVPPVNDYRADLRTWGNMIPY